MKKLLVGISILALASCSNPAADSNPESKAAPETQSDLQSESREQMDVNQSIYRWDFSKKRKFIYTYSQSVDGENKMGKNETPDKTLMMGNGFLNLQVKDGNLADLSLTDIEMQMVTFDKEETPLDTITQQIPTNVVENMKPDGSFGDSNTDILFDMLFPLPSKDLTVGEFEEIPLQIPFNAGITPLFAKGQNTLTLKGKEEFEGKNCDVFTGVIDVTDLDLPKDVKGEYRCFTTGNATYFFDSENGYYLGADIQMDMDILMDSGSAEGDPLGTYAEMNSRNSFRIRLKDIEE